MRKTIKNLGLLVMGAALMVSTLSCKEEGPDKDDIVRFESTINSNNTIPRSTSSAQGSAVLEYNKRTNTLSYNVTYQGITPTAAHIHSAKPAWETGPVEVPFANIGTSPITGSTVLSQDQENLLMLGNMYINIHSAEYPAGEIRGQVLLVEF
ncbi:CHRD domain-containing protein [Arundinibacter roseus]|uniref:CHRD domain-containing protein n=1 Tax=Arundinibacter roseus TaxID=2070510 RepID=A0A4R4KK71_9BACT|nr:CHRD domain-containing protein [Arundinibacter roseus]TDB66981.1 CHRD domain-containing protein [Arundinibacter roseus]